MSATNLMRTLRFHEYGEPSDVLRLEETSVPVAIAGTVAVKVKACGLNPADWALCRGLFPRDLPRGVGLDVSGVVTSVGDGVTGVTVGDRVFGPADYIRFPTAGASDYAVLSNWSSIPAKLGYIEAASLPLVVETACRYIAFINPKPGEMLVVNGAGTMVGFAAVQIALLKGVNVLATAGSTFAEQLRAFGALVTPYGGGMVERIRAMLADVPDHILDVAPVNLTPGRAPSALLDLVEAAGGDPKRVVTVADFAGAAETGVRTGRENIKSIDDVVMYWDKLSEYAAYAAEGRFMIPIGGTFALDAWRQALDISLSGQSHGKLILLIGSELEDG